MIFGRAWNTPLRNYEQLAGGTKNKMSQPTPTGDYWIAHSRRGWLFLAGLLTALFLFGSGAVFALWHRAVKFWRWMFD
jgi:hypothetical protein